MSALLASVIAAAEHATTSPAAPPPPHHHALTPHINLHHLRFNLHQFRTHLRSAPADYVGLALGAFASWVGVPGPGEPLLVAAGLLASKGKLDLATMLLVAWLAATIGGVAGWVIGMKAGRAVVTFPGPFRAARVKALEKGETVFQRYAAIAVMLSPSWVAGINRVRPSIFLPVNAVAAALWTLGIGLGAYFVGSTVLDLAQDVGTYGIIAVVVIGVAISFSEWFRRRRKARREAGAATG